MRAGAVYARTYLLGTAMARPVMAAHQVAVAQRLGAQALAHGCTGKGNDQVRIEATVATLAPELRSLYSLRVSRQDRALVSGASGLRAALPLLPSRVRRVADARGRAGAPLRLLRALAR
jgi:hypothetical protein